MDEILPGRWWDKFTAREDPPAKLLVECIEPVTRNSDNITLEFLENAVNRVSAVMQTQTADDKDIQLAKLYLLAHIVILQNELIMNQIIIQSSKIEESIRFWEYRRYGYRYWYLIEKTPIYWYQYAYLHQRVHPRRELEYRLARLKEIETISAQMLGGTYYLLSFMNCKNYMTLQAFLHHLLKHSMHFFEEFTKIVKTPLKRKEQTSELRSSIMPEENFDEIPDDVIKVEALFTMVKENLAATRNFVDESYIYLKRLGVPPKTSRNWLYVAGGVTGALLVARYGYGNWSSITTLATDAREALWGLFREHIVAPLKNIWKVIRYDNNELGLISDESVESSVRSLGHMVVDYVKEHNPNIGPDELLRIEAAARNGDITSVMADYEKEIASPLKNAIFGEMSRLLLIQVQKQKADVEKAMKAIDKLLKSNEINFQFLATIPAVLFLWVVNRIMFHRPDTNRDYYKNIRATLREISILLNRNNNQRKATLSLDHKSYTLPLEFDDFGRLIILIYNLNMNANKLKNKSYKQQLKEDLIELETETYDVQQRLATIQRMFATYPFLNGTK